jgi:hypothetical protein
MDAKHVARVYRPGEGEAPAQFPDPLVLRVISRSLWNSMEAYSYRHGVTKLWAIHD